MLGPQVNTLWDNVGATLVVGLLVLLLLIQMIASMFPAIDARWLVIGPGSVCAAVCLLLGGFALRRRHGRRQNASVARPRKQQQGWLVPPLEELPAPVHSLTRTIGLFILRIYLVCAVLLLILKVVHLATGH